jgi:hypothetical protein
MIKIVDENLHSARCQAAGTYLPNVRALQAKSGAAIQI